MGGTEAIEFGRKIVGLAGSLLLAGLVLGVPLSGAADGFVGEPPTQGGDPTQRLAELLEDPGVQEGLTLLRGSAGEAAELLVDIGGIESPSGQEHERARRVAQEFREMGLSDVEVTEAPNVLGRIPGRSGQAVVFISTLDDLQTVAMNQRERGRPPSIEGDRVVGPGTNTSTVTVAMIHAAQALLASGVEPEHDLIFAAVAEEETGLRGMHEVVERMGDRALAYIDILGDGRSISYGALSIHWWRVVGEGPPGHSLGGGLPNVNQGLARAADRILEWSRPHQDPENRTTVNISILRSGEVFNHKPAEGWFSLDLRSLDARTVEEMEEAVTGILQQVSEETGVTLQLDPEHLIPGGQIPGARESTLVRSSEAVARQLGLDPTFNPAGSSNMNVAVSRGVHAIGLGGSRGGARGEAEEWADVPAMMRTAEHVYLLAHLLSGAGLDEFEAARQGEP